MADFHYEISKKDLQRVLAHIEVYWPKLIRANKKDKGSLIGLPNPYIVPSDSAVFQEQYYWDSYPLVRALIDHPKYSHLAVGMVENLLHLVSRFGIVPNASRFYFLSRSQPPLLSSMVFIVYEKTKDLGWFRKAIKVVEREYRDVWMGQTHLANFRLVWHGLSRYYDINAIDSLAEAESGWDMTSRFDGRCLDFLPVDLNCLLYLYEKDFEKAYEILGDMKTSRKYKVAAKKRAETINELMWNNKVGYFFDFDFMHRRPSHLITVAGIYPMNVGIATKEQAERMVKVIETVLQKKYGVAQSVRFVENKQWDWPNGWAPLQLRVAEGLMRYGYNHLAMRIIKKWLHLNVEIFKETSLLWEKYDIVHGRIGLPDRYPTPHGFAWTNACFLILSRILNFLEEVPHERATPVWLVRHLGWH